MGIAASLPLLAAVGPRAQERSSAELASALALLGLALVGALASCAVERAQRRADADHPSAAAAGSLSAAGAASVAAGLGTLLGRLVGGAAPLSHALLVYSAGGALLAVLAGLFEARGPSTERRGTWLRALAQLALPLLGALVPLRLLPPAPAEAQILQLLPLLLLLLALSFLRLYERTSDALPWTATEWSSSAGAELQAHTSSALAAAERDALALRAAWLWGQLRARLGVKGGPPLELYLAPDAEWFLRARGLGGWHREPGPLVLPPEALAASQYDLARMLAAAALERRFGSSWCAVLREGAARWLCAELFEPQRLEQARRSLVRRTALLSSRELFYSAQGEDGQSAHERHAAGFALQVKVRFGEQKLWALYAATATPLGAESPLDAFARAFQQCCGVSLADVDAVWNAQSSVAGRVPLA